MRISRRNFFARSGLVAVAFGGLQKFVQGPAWGETTEELVKKDDEKLVTDFFETMDLPPGFSYNIFSETGEKMDDGLIVPGKHDGMGAFNGSNGKTILVRNHEVETGQTDSSPFGPKRAGLRRIDIKKLYDGGKGKKPGLGGTTTLVYDTKTKRLEKHFLSLGGTYRNCAGGVTPWNTWITCEETVETAENDIEKDHGYNFEVPASERIALTTPVPLIDMGRFRHEAVAVDPKTGIVYQTEDRSDGLLYRFIPKRPGKLVEGGKLQALKIRNSESADTRNWKKQTFQIGESVAVEWVDINDVESPDDDLRYQGRYESGTARFARGEGIWYGRESIFFACTNGGKKKRGQIWRYFPSAREGTSGEDKNPGKLELFIEPNDSKLVDNADNLTISPWGDLVVCEDGTNPQFLFGVTPEGAIYKIGKTNMSELAGACFSPDATTLFVNIQNPGLTLAITGPWENLRKQRKA